MTDDERLAKIVDSSITLPRWRFIGSILVAFLVGWQFAPEFAATSWYRPVTAIFRVLLLLGLLFVGITQLIQENKKTSKNRP